MMKPPSKKGPSSNKDSKEEVPRRFNSAKKMGTNPNISRQTLKQQQPQRPQLPKRRRPVDALSYANEIIKKANQVEHESQSHQGTVKSGDSLEVQTISTPIPSIVSNNNTKPPSFKSPINQGYCATSEGSYQKMNKQALRQQTPIEKVKKQSSLQSPSKQLQQMLTQYQRRETQLLSKVDMLGQQLHQLQKQADKKYTTLSKEHKLCSKQIKRLNDVIQEHQSRFTRYLSDAKVPYNNKRQAILQTHIQKLRQYNWELTVRLKAYKGTDMEQLANSQVNVNVLNDYMKQGQGKGSNSEDKLTLESLAFKISRQLDDYLIKKSKGSLIFNEEQKYLVALVSLLNLFGFECLIQGISISRRETDPGDFRLKEAMLQKSVCPPLVDDYNKIISHSEFNLTVVTETQQVIDNMKPLLSNKQRVCTTIADCFRSSKKLPEIQKRLQDTLGYTMRAHRNTNCILLSVLATTLGRYDILRNYVDNMTRDLRKRLRELSKPLKDLESLCLYRDQDQQVFKQKLTAFVVNNLQRLAIQTPQLEKQMEQVPIRFGKLVKYV